jgi:hypothetical protein
MMLTTASVGRGDGVRRAVLSVRGDGAFGIAAVVEGGPRMGVGGSDGAVVELIGLRRRRGGGGGERHAEFVVGGSEGG